MAVLLALSLAFTSCSDLLGGGSEEEETVEASIVPRKTTLAAEDSGSIFVEVTVSGDWTLQMEFPSGVEEWASVDPSSGTGTKGDVRFRYTENTGEARSVVLVLVTKKGAEATVTINQLGAGESIETGMGNYGYDVAYQGWLEMPSTTAGDGNEVLIHDMTGGRYVSSFTSGVRNWSCYWDYDEHLSHWVAYPLNNKLIGSGSYEYIWGYDPLLPVGLQPDITSHSYGGKSFDGEKNWNRGHQIPRADRKTSQAAVASTCYPTNLTPQDGTFNGNIWANLEQQVRNYAYKADTLYVVTGAIFEDSTLYSGTSSGFAVKIPTYYYKALLYRGSASAASATGGFLSAAFLLPHSYDIAEGNYMDYIITVDALEEKTGIDYFPNLVALIGQDKAASVEKEVNSWWK